MPSKLQAIGHLVIVEKQIAERVTEGGIHLPDTVDIEKQDKLIRGLVVAVGELVSKRVTEGCWVLYPYYAGNSWEYGEKTYTTVKDDKILSVESV